MTDLLTSIEGTALATWVRESPSIWAYATIITLHTAGLAIVVGINAVVALRALGWGPRIPVPALSPLFPVMWWGFAINFGSGALLFMADATTKARQPVFYVKLACIALALMVARALAAALSRRDHGTVSRSMQTLAALSLLLWAGAIVAGRLMAYS